MIDLDRQRLPGLALILVGLYVALDAIAGYVEFAMDPPSHRLGFLTEFLTLSVLLVAAVLIGVGVWAFRHRHIAEPLAFLVGILALQATFWIDLYSISQNTQFVVALGLAASIVPALATYLLIRWKRPRTPST